MSATPSFARRAAAVSARRPRTMIVLWILLVIGCFVAGGMAGTKELTGADAGVGESARADRLVTGAGLENPAVESVLVRSSSAARTAAAAQALEARLKRVPDVSAVHGPRDTPALSRAGGKVVLVQASLRGDPDDSGKHVDGVARAVSASHAPGVTLQQAGPGSLNKTIDDVVADDLQRAELISVPITLLILLLAFGALVAACVPLLLGLTSVAAAMGALGVVSQIAPLADTTGSLVVLIGLAVGVDYSLFYIRREREERRAGRGADAALEAAAATVGRAILVSGITVIVALAGLLVTGLSVFASSALGTMLVVAISVIGSLTVLPAVLSLLGDRVDKGRVPLLGRRSGRVRKMRLAHAVTRFPAASLLVAVVLLGALAAVGLGMKTGNGGGLPSNLPVIRAQDAIEQAFPGSPESAQLVVTGRGLERSQLRKLGVQAREITGGRGAVSVDVAKSGRTALVSVPLPDQGADGGAAIVRALRDKLGPDVLVTGAAARDADFTDRLNDRLPLVIAFVLGLAMVLLLAAFRSVKLAIAVMALNLLSVGASYGVLVAVFQHSWAEGILGFESSGTIINWLPLFAFVILFGLSMDYTVLVLERIREGRREGLNAREAAAQGVGHTAGTVTSAAAVMVGVFAVFATLRLLDMKQLGVGLAAAVLLDATIVRAIALPAAVALLGDRGWRVRHIRSRYVVQEA